MIKDVSQINDTKEIKSKKIYVKAVSKEWTIDVI